ncbi:hypothetical protein JY446_24225 [Serratia marcescens]|nr:hypothetical protein [Serratia marcescens]
MSEFSTAPTVSTPSESSPTHTMPAKPGLMQRKLLFSLTLPWLAGAVLTLGLSAVYLFAPDLNGGDSGSAATPDAFSESEYVQSPAPVTLAPVTSAGSADSVQLQNDVATMVGGVRSFAETNRTAISRLSDTVKTQSTALAAMKQQMADLQAQNNQLLVRLPQLASNFAPSVTPVLAMASGPDGLMNDPAPANVWALRPEDFTAQLQLVHTARRSIGLPPRRCSPRSWVNLCVM